MGSYEISARCFLPDVEVGCVADAVIVGRAISQLIEAYIGQPELVTWVGEFVGSLKRALREVATQPSA